MTTHIDSLEWRPVEARIQRLKDRVSILVMSGKKQVLR